MGMVRRLAPVALVVWLATAGAAPINSGGLQAGHEVVYPLFLIDGYITQFRLTNHHPEDDVRVELVAICSGERSFGGKGFCAKHDRAVSLTHNQTLVRNVRNYFSLDPAQCPTGFITATAISKPGFNLLSGSTYMRRTSGTHPNAAAGAHALAIRSDGSVSGGTVLRTDFTATTHPLDPRQGRRSGLALLNLDARAGASNDPTQVAIDWHNAAEDRFSGGLEFYCHVYRELHEINGGFRIGTLGSYNGNLEITPLGGAPVIGQIHEIEPNRDTLRSLFLD